MHLFKKRKICVPETMVHNSTMSYKYIPDSEDHRIDID